jgi:hypothetical protein
MTDNDFERRLERGLRAYADRGTRPFDAVQIARTAAAGGSTRVARERRSGMPAWARALALTALLIVMTVAIAFAGGFIRLPSTVVEPSPSATAVAFSPSPSLTVDPSVTPAPTTSVDPSASPSGSPTLAPSLSPSVGPSLTPSASPPPTPASPSPPPSPSPSPTPIPTPVSGWREVGFPESHRVAVTSVAERAGRFVAVGYINEPFTGGAAWYSDDGRTWSAAAGFDILAGGSVVATDDGFIAVGRSGDNTAMAHSADGITWTRVAAPPELGFVNDIAYENGVTVAVGSNDDFDQAMVWTSEDGQDWTSIAAPDATSELTRVAVRGGDIAVIGDDFTGHGRRLFVRLANSVDWQEHEPFGEDVDGRLLDLATDGGRFVAVGYEDDFDTGQRMGSVRTSVDGTSWTRSNVLGGDDGRGLVFDQVVALPDGRFFAVGGARQFSVAECQPDPCAALDETATGYLSADGITWQAARVIYQRHEDSPPEVGDEVGNDRAVVAGAAGVVIADDWRDGLHVFFGPLGELE